MASFKDRVNNLLDIATNVFGEDVEYTPRSTGSPMTLRAVFDEVFVQIDPNTEAQVATNQPILGIKLADLPDIPRRNDKVVREINGRLVSYKVIDSQEDGQGGASLFLQLVKKRDFR